MAALLQHPSCRYGPRLVLELQIIFAIFNTHTRTHTQTKAHTHAHRTSLINGGFVPSPIAHFLPVITKYWAGLPLPFLDYPLSLSIGQSNHSLLPIRVGRGGQLFSFLGLCFYYCELTMNWAPSMERKLTSRRLDEWGWRGERIDCVLFQISTNWVRSLATSPSLRYSTGG
jgi:hypothetical protein